MQLLELLNNFIKENKKTLYLIVTELLLLSIIIIQYKLLLGFLLLLFTVCYIIYLIKDPFLSIPLVIFALLGGNLSSYKATQYLSYIYIIDFVIILTMFALIFKSLQEDSILKISLTKLELIFLLYLIWCFIVNIHSIDPVRGMAYLRYNLIGWLVFLLSNRVIHNQKNIQKTIVFLMIFGALLSLMQLYYLFSRQNLIVAIILKDIHLPIGSSNYIAAFYVMLIPIAIALLQVFEIRKSYKVYLLINIIIMLTCLMLTGSRGGIIAIFAGSLLWIKHISNKRSIKNGVILLILITSVVYINPSTQFVIHNISRIQSSASVLSRIDTWNESMRIFLDNPIFGVGLGNVHYYIQNYLVNSTGHFALVKAHNIILELMVETGIVGLILFMILIISVIYYQYKSAQIEKHKYIQWIISGAIIANACAIIHSLFEPTILTYLFGVMYWIIISISTRNIHSI